MIPIRRFESEAHFKEVFSLIPEIICDGTENAIQRPQKYEKQKLKYSGKKSTHTDIALVISDKARKIHYLSQLYDGREVDFGIFKKEFPPEFNWFENLKLLVDLGFLGIDKLYKIKELIIGEKKKRKSKKNPKTELTEPQKEHNKQVSRERIYVEHAIGGMKIYRILKEKCRIKNINFRNKIIGICAGLWNFHLSISH